jgi:heme/copper-type cytochrome/quinol oxidase subunit 3
MTIFLGALFLCGRRRYGFLNGSAFNINGIFGLRSSCHQFHGLHVLVGIIFLNVVTARRSGVASLEQNFLQAASWYWHFVDVV